MQTCRQAEAFPRADKSGLSQQRQETVTLSTVKVDTWGEGVGGWEGGPGYTVGNPDTLLSVMAETGGRTDTEYLLLTPRNRTQYETHCNHAAASVRLLYWKS